VAFRSTNPYTARQERKGTRLVLPWSEAMPTINIQAEVSVDVLVKAVEQLREAELRQFTARILALNAKRMAPSVTQEEAELLLQINSPLPADIQRRFDELIRKRDAETLNNEEYVELLRLTQQVEAFDVARLEALTKLAVLRGVTLPELMRQLDIKPSSDACA
jgi:hypothetical protein